MLAVLESDAWAHDLLDKGPEQGRHSAVLQWEDHYEMLCGNDRPLRLDQAFRKTTIRLELLLRAQNWELETGHLDAHDFKGGSPGS